MKHYYIEKQIALLIREAKNNYIKLFSKFASTHVK